MLITFYLVTLSMIPFFVLWENVSAIDTDNQRLFPAFQEDSQLIVIIVLTCILAPYLMIGIFMYLILFRYKEPYRNYTNYPELLYVSSKQDISLLKTFSIPVNTCYGIFTETLYKYDPKHKSYLCNSYLKHNNSKYPTVLDYLVSQNKVFTLTKRRQYDTTKLSIQA